MKALTRYLRRSKKQLSASALARGHELKGLGDGVGAARRYRIAAALQPTRGETWWSLANLKTYQFTNSELRKMIRMLPRTTKGSFSRAALSYAMGHAFEQRDDYDRAWNAFKRGASLQRARLDFSQAQARERLQLIASHWNDDGRKLALADEYMAFSPLFVLGLPRSGSTLVEQVLASHSTINSIGETGLIAQISHGQTPQTTQLNDLARSYVRGIGPLLPNDECRPLDKTPANYLHIGLLSQLFPGALFIDVRRHPLDTCVANLHQLYPGGEAHSYVQEEMATHYLDYYRLMQHWKKMLPGKVINVSYENLVEKPQREIQMLLARCGLSEETACLQPQRTQRLVRTASALQVRQPIHRERVGHWRNYEAHIGPLQKLLEPIL